MLVVTAEMYTTWNLQFASTLRWHGVQDHTLQNIQTVVQDSVSP